MSLFDRFSFGAMANVKSRERFNFHRKAARKYIKTDFSYTEERQKKKSAQTQNRTSLLKRNLSVPVYHLLCEEEKRLSQGSDGGK